MKVGWLGDKLPSLYRVSVKRHQEHSLNPSIILNIVIFLPGLLLGIVAHEVAHGWAANRLGDPTARMLGRLSLNPIKHIDPWGTILLPVFLLVMSQGSMVFGYAKPVPITMENFKNPRRDQLLVSFAGPAANIAIAIVITLVAWLGRYLGFTANPGFSYVLQATININIFLAALNLIPIPPLDGSHILESLLPGPWAYRFQKLAPYSFLILMGLFVTGILGYIIIPFTLVIRLILMPFGNPFI